MADIVPADWTINRLTGDIRYVGDDHSGASPSYSEVIKLHRWVQSLADDAIAVGDDEMDITNVNPSARSTDNIITFLGDYNIDDTASEHLFDGSIIQNNGDDIYDGIVNFGNSDVQIHIIQNGAILTDDWWNFNGGGLNANALQGKSHQFMLPVRVGGSDIDGRRILGIVRTWNNTYGEFPINGTSRGNNVLALSDSEDLNNTNTIGTVSGWTGITLVTPGYVGLDILDTGALKYFYSEWNADFPTRSTNDFYERMKYLTRIGETTTLYGLEGQIFRGITHEIAYSSLTGTFDESNPVSWTGSSSGTGQVLADNGTDKLWIQILTGDAPISSVSLSQTSPDAASATAGTVTDRTSTIKTPFVGVSTGSSLIGAFGLGIQPADLDAQDKVFDLTNTQYSPPSVITNSVTGLVFTPDSDRVLVGPWDGSTLDVGGIDPLLQKHQFEVSTALTTDNITSLVIKQGGGDEAPVPVDTPSSGYIRVTDNDGFERRLHYSAWVDNGSTGTFTIDTTDGNEDFATVNADADNWVYLAYIDEAASSSSASYQATYATDRDLVIVVRDGGATPIKQFISSWSFTSSNQSIAVIRTTDV